MWLRLEAREEASQGKNGYLQITRAGDPYRRFACAQGWANERCGEAKVAAVNSRPAEGTTQAWGGGREPGPVAGSRQSENAASVL